MPQLGVERIAETEENSELSIDKRLSSTKNYKVDFPQNISPSRNTILKGSSNHHYTYKVMNMNMKNQNNFYSDNFLSSNNNIIKDAMLVKNVHNQILGTNNTLTVNKGSSMNEAFTEIKQRKRPITSKNGSTLSNMSNRLSNQFNSTFMKNDHEKNKMKPPNKVNNLYFNNYIDMQFRSNNPLKSGGLTNRNMITHNTNKEESSYYITSTKNEKFTNEQNLQHERKVVNII